MKKVSIQLLIRIAILLASFSLWFAPKCLKTLKMVQSYQYYINYDNETGTMELLKFGKGY